MLLLPFHVCFTFSMHIYRRKTAVVTTDSLLQDSQANSGGDTKKGEASLEETI